MSLTERSLVASALAVGVAVGLAVLAYGGGNIAALIGFLLMGAFGIEVTLTRMFLLSVITIQLLFFTGVSLVYLRYRGFSLADIGVRKPSLEDWIAAGAGFVGLIIAWLAASISSFFVATRFDIEQPQQEIFEMGQQDPMVFVLLGVLSLLIVGPAEELLFRGVIQTRLRENFGVVAGLGIATALFALIHIVGFLEASLISGLLGVSVLFVIGAVLAIVYEYTGNLVIVAILHGVFNAIQAALGYVSVTFGDPDMVATIVSILAALL